MAESSKELTTRGVLQTWWPLAASWMLIAIELPIQSAFIARLAEPEINLAAYGSIVLPVALLIEAPIIALLSASTALSRDMASYAKLRRFTLLAIASLTVLHVLIVFTPLYYVLVEGLISPPPEVVEPARLGLMIMTPWSMAIGYRRFNQGVLIRFGHSRAVGLGTFIRLTVNAVVLVTVYLLGTIPGVVMASCSLVAGVTSEAIFVGLRVRPVIHHHLRWAAPVKPPLTPRMFLAFYIPLALTQLIGLLTEPMVSAGLSRMKDPLASLAVWPVLFGLVFMMQSLSIAYIEVVVALLDRPGAWAALRRFTLGLTAFSVLLPVVVVATPLSMFWFEKVSALPPSLANMAQKSLWLALPVPALTALYCWFHGVIVHSQRTRAITEAVIIYIAAIAAVLSIGALVGNVTGIYVGIAAVMVASVLEAIWLWWRSGPARQTAHPQLAAVED